MNGPRCSYSSLCFAALVTRSPTTSQRRTTNSRTIREWAHRCARRPRRSRSRSRLRDHVRFFRGRIRRGFAVDVADGSGGFLPAQERPDFDNNKNDNCLTRRNVLLHAAALVRDSRSLSGSNSWLPARLALKRVPRSVITPTLMRPLSWDMVRATPNTHPT